MVCLDIIKLITVAELFRRARAKCFTCFLLSLPASALAVSCKLDVTLCRRYPGCEGGGGGGGRGDFTLVSFPFKTQKREKL